MGGEDEEEGEVPSDKEQMTRATRRDHTSRGVSDVEEARKVVALGSEGTGTSEGSRVSRKDWRQGVGVSAVVESSTEFRHELEGSLGTGKEGENEASASKEKEMDSVLGETTHGNCEGRIRRRRRRRCCLNDSCEKVTNNDNREGNCRVNFV